jgi:hypothetical protein
MELHVEMQSADTDMDVDEPKGSTCGTQGTAPYALTVGTEMDR